MAEIEISYKALNENLGLLYREREMIRDIINDNSCIPYDEIEEETDAIAIDLVRDKESSPTILQLCNELENLSSLIKRIEGIVIEFDFGKYNPIFRGD